MKDIVVPLLAALIGAIAGAVGSVWVTRKQLQIAFDQTKLEALRSQMQKLEQVLVQISGLRIDVQGDLTGDQILPKYVAWFQQKTGYARPYFHFLPKDLVDEISRLNKGISEFILGAKTGSQIDEEESRNQINAMQIAEQRLEDEINNTLRVWQAEVAFLTSRKRSKSHQAISEP